MKTSGVLLCAGLLLGNGLFSNALLAQDDRRPHQGGSNTDVVVDLPPEVWTQGQNSQQNAPCPRCCVYENRSYSEGAVIKMEGVLLQCMRDRQSLGTNNLIWQSIKQ